MCRSPSITSRSWVITRRTSSVLAVSADAPWQTLDDLIAYVHANPGKLNYASAGVGTVSSLSMQALAHHFKLDMVAVPFPGGAQLTSAIIGNHVDIGMVPYTTGAGMFQAQKLRGLATTAANRLPQWRRSRLLLKRALR